MVTSSYFYNNEIRSRSITFDRKPLFNEHPFILDNNIGLWVQIGNWQVYLISPFGVLQLRNMMGLICEVNPPVYCEGFQLSCLWVSLWWLWGSVWIGELPLEVAILVSHLVRRSFQLKLNKSFPLVAIDGWDKSIQLGFIWCLSMIPPESLKVYGMD